MKYTSKLILNWTEYEFGAVWGWHIPTTWLIAYYPFDSDMNDHKSDLWVSWTTYNCTPGSSGNYSYVTWKVDDCIYQSATWSYMWVDSGIMLWNVFSISAWINFTTNNGWNICWWNQWTDGGVGIQWQFDGLNIATQINNTYYDTWEDFTIWTWWHYVVTQDGSEFKQYVNGVLKATDTVNSNAWAVTLKLLWRWFDSYGSPVKMDDVLVYNRVLTAQEVSDYYNATA